MTVQVPQCVKAVVLVASVAALVVIVVVVVVFSSGGGGSRLRQEKGAVVLMISLDGFGRHYLNHYPGHNLARLYSRGAHPTYFRNQFITKTMPNHWSISTGTYEEVHGVVNNIVYDKARNVNLTVADPALFNQNPAILPIWTVNEESGGHSVCVMWPGCNFPYHGRNVTFHKPYRPDAQLRESIDIAVEWLTNSHTPVNLVMIYHDQPDTVGHAYGPNSPEVKEMLKQIDTDLGYLLHKLKLFELDEVVDVILLSDHGMREINEDNLIDLSSIVDTSKFFTTGISPVLSVWPVQGVSDLDVYLPLKKQSSTHHYRVLEKQQSQDLVTWHYQHNSRISSITLLADDNYVFQDIQGFKKYYLKRGYSNMTKIHGLHGYPPNSTNMLPIFVARGPSFRRGFTTPEFSNLDIYPLLCHLLRIPPGPNNGSLEAIRPILAEPVTKTLILPLIVVLGCIIVLVGLVTVVGCILTRHDHRPKVSADALINGYVYRKTLKRDNKARYEELSEEEHLLETEVEEV